MPNQFPDRPDGSNVQGRVNWLVAMVCAFGLSVLSGCATRGEPPPEAQLGAAKSAIAQAEAAGAGKSAAVELLSAREKLGQAEASVRAKDNQQARWLAEQAEADARLAEARTRALQSGNAVTEIQQSIQTLRSELQRQQSLQSKQ